MSCIKEGDEVRLRGRGDQSSRHGDRTSSKDYHQRSEEYQKEDGTGFQCDEPCYTGHLGDRTSLLGNHAIHQGDKSSYHGDQTSYWSHYAEKYGRLGIQPNKSSQPSRNRSSDAHKSGLGNYDKRDVKAETDQRRRIRLTNFRASSACDFDDCKKDLSSTFETDTFLSSSLPARKSPLLSEEFGDQSDERDVDKSDSGSDNKPGLRTKASRPHARRFHSDLGFTAPPSVNVIPTPRTAAVLNNSTLRRHLAKIMGVEQTSLTADDFKWEFKRKETPDLSQSLPRKSRLTASMSDAGLQCVMRDEEVNREGVLSVGLNSDNSEQDSKLTGSKTTEEDKENHHGLKNVNTTNPDFLTPAKASSRLNVSPLQESATSRFAIPTFEEFKRMKRSKTVSPGCTFNAIAEDAEQDDGKEWQEFGLIPLRKAQSTGHLRASDTPNKASVTWPGLQQSREKSNETPNDSRPVIGDAFNKSSLMSKTARALIDDVSLVDKLRSDLYSETSQSAFGPSDSVNDPSSDISSEKEDPSTYERKSAQRRSYKKAKKVQRANAMRLRTASETDDGNKSHHLGLGESLDFKDRDSSLDTTDSHGRAGLAVDLVERLKSQYSQISSCQKECFSQSSKWNTGQDDVAHANIDVESGRDLEGKLGHSDLDPQEDHKSGKKPPRPHVTSDLGQGHLKFQQQKGKLPAEQSRLEHDLDVTKNVPEHFEKPSELNDKDNRQDSKKDVRDVTRTEPVHSVDQSGACINEDVNNLYKKESQFGESHDNVKHSKSYQASQSSSREPRSHGDHSKNIESPLKSNEDIPEDTELPSSNWKSVRESSSISHLKIWGKTTSLPPPHPLSAGLDKLSVTRSTSDVSDLKGEEARKKPTKSRRVRAYRSDPFSLNARRSSADHGVHSSLTRGSRKSISSDTATPEEIQLLANQAVKPATSSGALSSRSQTSLDSSFEEEQEDYSSELLGEFSRSASKNSFCRGRRRKECASCSEVERVDSGVGAELRTSNNQDQFCDDCEVDVDSNVGLIPLCQRCARRRIERKAAILELINTESSYGNDLTVMKEEFADPMRKTGLLSPAQCASIFSNLDELISINAQFKVRLKSAVEEAAKQGDQEYSQMCLGQLFLESSNMLLAFETYCIKQSEAVASLDSLEKEKDLLRVFLEASQNEKCSLKRRDLKSFLMVPIQRVMKYPLLLNRIYKATPHHHCDRKHLKEAQDRVKDILDSINHKAKDRSAILSVKKKLPDLWRGGSWSHLNEELEIQKAGIELLGWLKNLVQVVLTGRLLQTQPVDHLWMRKVRNIKFTPTCALLAAIETNQQDDTTHMTMKSHDQARSHDNPNKSHDTVEAALVLMKEKNGTLVAMRPPIYLRHCIVVMDPACTDVFELCEMPKESFLFKSDKGPQETLNWLGNIRRFTRTLGKWRKRRGALPNIMFSNFDK